MPPSAASADRPMPTPEGAISRTEFAERLKELMEWTGRSYRDIAAVSARSRYKIARSTAANLTAGCTVPTQRSLTGFLYGCGLGPDQQRPWIAKREQIYGSMAAVVSADRPVESPDPFALGVHAVVSEEGSASRDDLPRLPPYIERSHDRLLREILTGADQNVMLLLIGTSATGKTRSCYELLVRHLSGWRLIHPLTAAELADVLHAPLIPRSVLWLDETQRYLDGSRGEENTAGLHRTLTRHAGPIIVLGTIWPDELKRLSSARSRLPLDQLLRLTQVHQIPVPEDFREIREPDEDRIEELVRLDVRLAAAARSAGIRGPVTQALAGGPMLVRGYQLMPASIDRALLRVAMDARVMGYRQALPQAILMDAVPEYLNDEQRAVPGTGWFDAALARITTLTHGVRALTPVRTRPGIGRIDAYMLHDYLAQYAQATRARGTPPAGMWLILVRHCHDPAIQFDVGYEAEIRGLYRYALPLLGRAALAGYKDASSRFVTLLDRTGRFLDAITWSGRLHSYNPDYMNDVRMAAHHEARGRPDEAQAFLGQAMDKGWTPWGGEFEGFKVVARQHFDERLEQYYRHVADQDHPGTWREFGKLLLRTGREQEAEVWLRRAAGAGVNTLGALSAVLMRRGARAEAEEQLRREFTDTAYEVAVPLARLLEERGDLDEAERVLRLGKAREDERDSDFDPVTDALADFLVRHARVDKGSAEMAGFWINLAPGTLAFLEREGRLDEAEHWLRTQAARNHWSSANLAEFLSRTGRHDEGEEVLRRAADREPVLQADLAAFLYRAGKTDEVNGLMRRAWERKSGREHVTMLAESMGRHDEAEHQLRRDTILGTDTHARWELAALLDRHGKSEEARQFQRFGLEPDGTTAQQWDLSESLEAE